MDDERKVWQTGPTTICYHEALSAENLDAFNAELAKAYREGRITASPGWPRLSLWQRLGNRLRALLRSS